MAKRNHLLAPKDSERGQISIFFSASLVVFISIIAFVINVGLFVKAKINLQNATDASAWAGAAVQSRQLTKIAYLNWEMRNIYKEWMYKYYVVGNLNAPGVEDPASNSSACTTGKCTNFRLATDTNVITGSQTADAYNFPAVCIHIAGSKTNVCKRFAVPGIPEFGGSNMPGTEEASRSFQDVLIGSKINDCVRRSKLNMLVTTTWAYNVLAGNSGDALMGQGPAILTDRQGAWPKAMELGMRIRNLEKVMNRESRSGPVCASGGSCTPIQEVESEKFLGNERIIKAFYSGYRNLGNEIDNEMKSTFALTELPPNKLPFEEYSNSSLLIPSVARYEKQYVDLKLMMVNLATFYAALIPRADSVTSGACDISKVAIPIPGYPLGFYKNPGLVTYYAVKGEAEFAGMFNPFSSDSIKLTAYAAAKPAGGRIGPMLFTQLPTIQAIFGRTEPSKFRSGPYVSSLNVVGTYNKFAPAPDFVLPSGQFYPGAPLPINLGSGDDDFWITDPSYPIGGQPSGTKIQFGIPNLVYDFANSNMDPFDYTFQGSPLHTITPKNPATDDKPVGLYNHDLFVKFKGNIAGAVSPSDLADQISRVRAPTQYEAANYLIPTPNELNSSLGVDSFGSIPGTGTPLANLPAVQTYKASFYAPLYKGSDNEQLDILFESPSVVLSTMIEFMRKQKPAIDNYTVSLNYAARQTYKTAGDSTEAAVGAVPRYKAAAQKISDIDVEDNDPANLKTARPKSCESLAGNFYYFYYGYSNFGFLPSDFNTSSCPSTNLGSLLQEYLSASPNDPSFSSKYYNMEYHLKRDNFDSIDKIYSAYMPGPYNGVGDDGTLTPPPGFKGIGERMRRNFYSTKLVTLDSVQKNGLYDEIAGGNFAIYSEGNITVSGASDGKQNTFVNYLNADAVPDEIKH